VKFLSCFIFAWIINGLSVGLWDCCYSLL
jgi:hypothetical protein